jgi:hypothetical protein
VRTRDTGFRQDSMGPRVSGYVTERWSGSEGERRVSVWVCFLVDCVSLCLLLLPLSLSVCVSECGWMCRYVYMSVYDACVYEIWNMKL